MPIKPENKGLYPPNWRQIREQILYRARGCCEGSPAYPDCRAEAGSQHPVTASWVVLTIAHLDHDPANCDPANLRAWCQRCHLTYDAPYHQREAAKTRRAKKGMPDLFG